MRVETAIKMIENHGHKAFVTAEGLACVCNGVIATLERSAQDIAFADDDCVFEEVTTFDTVDEYGETIVCVDDIRNWLGY